MLAALVIGLLNTLVRPVLVLLTLPVTLLTLGLFYFVLNGLLFWLAGEMLSGFEVHGFVAAVLGAILYSVIAWALSALVPAKKAEPWPNVLSALSFFRPKQRRAQKNYVLPASSWRNSNPSFFQ